VAGRVTPARRDAATARQGPARVNRERFDPTPRPEPTAAERCVYGPPGGQGGTAGSARFLGPQRPVPEPSAEASAARSSLSSGPCRAVRARRSSVSGALGVRNPQDAPSGSTRATAA
jgi:hypothetical protein